MDKSPDAVYILALPQMSGAWHWRGEFYYDFDLAHAEVKRMRAKDPKETVQVFTLCLVNMDRIHSNAINEDRYLEHKEAERKSLNLLASEIAMLDPDRPEAVR